MRIKKTKNLKKILLQTVSICILLPVLVIIYMASYTFSLEDWKNFDPHSLEAMNQSLVIYDNKDSEYICLDGGENRRIIDVCSLPPHVKNAFIAIEDNRFYEHNGIDLIRIGGAVINDIKSGNLKEGASTISQQLVKTAALSSSKTVSRKLSEIMMAFKTERVYEKNEILSLYLNMVYFGNGAYGIEAASLAYFGKHAQSLSISEAATLAGTLKSPSGYAPHINPEKSLNRRNTVLYQMLENGYITQKEYKNALEEPIKAQTRNSEYAYGYYTDAVLNEAADILGLDMSSLLSGGYSIYTSLDTKNQEYIENLMDDDALFPLPADDGEEPEAAVVLLDPDTAQICALVGGREHTNRLSFSRATGMRRQPGSAIKPVLVFAPALEYEGYTSTSFLLDQPIKFGDYAPRNSGRTFRGWVTLRDTVAYSVNIPAVSMLDELGINRAKSYGESVGIKFDDKDNNLSLALGGFTNGITPLELASSYQPFANGGYYSSPSAIRYIKDADGNIIYSSSSRAKHSVLSEETAFIMTSMLTSSVEYGTAKKLYCRNIRLAAKTGTTTYDDAVNNKDAWITAYNSDYILSVWTGFDKTDSLHSLKKGETGGSCPAMLAKKIFEHIYKDKKAPVFNVPKNIVEVVIDSEALYETLETVPAMAGSETGISEYYTYNTAPKAYENDDIRENTPAFYYHDIEQ